MKGNYNNSLNPKCIILIYNILRDLGFKSTTIGTKIINKTIQIILIYNFDEFVNINKIYKLVSKQYDSLNANKVQAYINYAIKNRISEKSESNFEKIFNFSYDEYFFSNKNIIFEIANIIKFNKYI